MALVNVGCAEERNSVESKGWEVHVVDIGASIAGCVEIFGFVASEDFHVVVTETSWNCYIHHLLVRVQLDLVVD